MDGGPERGSAYDEATSFEDRYLGFVRHELRDVPRRERKVLMDGVAADLAERPDAEAWAQLVAELGEPAAYAATVRSEDGLPAKVGAGAHIRATRWYTRLALVLVVVLSIGAFGYHRWSLADPGIVNKCSGVTAEAGVTVQDRDAGIATEQRISYVDGATVGLDLCLSAPHDLEIVDVDLGAPPRSLFQPAVVRAADMSADPGVTAPKLEPTHLASRDDGVRVTIEGRLTDCEWYSPGGGNSFETAQVTYRYRGRTQTAPVELHTTYTFVSPPTADCPRPSQHR